MPRYDFQCKKCERRFEKFMKMSARSSKALCTCGKWANKVFTVPNLITDTNFCMTGVEDKRFSEAGQKGLKIEGRKHWKQLVESKGYMELSDSQLKS